MTLQIAPSREELMILAADRLVAEAQTAIAERGRWIIALSGGSTPKALFELLASPQYLHKITWGRAFLFWGDERCVGPDDLQSNYRMTKIALIDHIPIPVANVLRIRGELASESAASLYAHEIKRIFGLAEGQLPQFDTMLLGLGNDGHTASLFPESDILGRDDVLVAETWVAKLKQYRISLTAPVINNARSKLFLAAGADKANVIRELLEQTGNYQNYPASLIRNADWLIDQAAASQLQR
ncbi:6-phosphogluconolactonase [Herpetosiphon sp. NSE202]|uniref:6-phosphogluconolactonase n=1 Tax=Herpetosiphon sp. NSE202 TaxID=3351349 RepID=UPI00362B8732